MLAVRRSGSGIPLVFLHAFPLSSQMWEVNRPALAKNFQLIAVDFPGFGGSAVSSNTSTMEDMATQVVQTLDGLKIQEKVVLAGLSMGGYVLMQLIQCIPERLRAAAFISTRTAADTPQARENRFKNIALVEKEGLGVFAEKQVQALLGKSTLAGNPAVVKSVQEAIAGANAQGVTAALRGMAARPDSTAPFSKLEVPALLISGGEDGIIPSAEMEGMAKLLKKSEFHTIPNAGHLLNLEQPQAFQDLFLSFLKRRVL